MSDPLPHSFEAYHDMRTALTSEIFVQYIGRSPLQRKVVGYISRRSAILNPQLDVVSVQSSAQIGRTAFGSRWDGEQVRGSLFVSSILLCNVRTRTSELRGSR